MKPATEWFQDLGQWSYRGECFSMVCPVCDFQNVHIDEVRMVGSAGQYAALRAPGEDTDHPAEYTDGVYERTQWQTRRHVVVLIGWCESGHNFEIGFTQHKGDTYVEASRLPDTKYDQDGLIVR